MKTRIREVIVIAAALLFVSSGAAFAQERNSRPGNYDKRWNSLGHYKKVPVERSYPGKNNYDSRKNYGHADRRFYPQPYRPQKFEPRHAYSRYPQRYPSWNTFFFGFSMR